MKVKVPVYGTIGKAVVVDLNAGAQIGLNLRGPDGRVLTVAELRALLGLNGGVIRHRDLQGLQTGDDHPQYAMWNGRETIRGQWDFTQPVWFADGTATAPSITFTSDKTLGVLKPGPNRFGVSVAATLRADFTTSALRLLQDSYDLMLGAGQDLALGHDGTNSYIENITGQLDVSSLGSVTLSVSSVLKATFAAAGNTWTTPNLSNAGDASTPAWAVGAGLGIYNAGDALNVAVGATRKLFVDIAVARFVEDNYSLEVGANGDGISMMHTGTESIIGTRVGNLLLGSSDVASKGVELFGMELSTGANTPTLGTNKPGSAVSLTPTTWMTTIVNGTTYYIPLWE